MMLLVQCLVLCAVFSLAILPAQYRNPLSQFASYPTAIKKRVYGLPQYKDAIASVEQRHWKRKILGALLIVALMAGAAYFSGNKTFDTAFIHVFILLSAVNLYDLIVLDLIVFCHSKKLMIPGTEDMKEEYRKPTHHIIGALKGFVISAVAALLAASLVLVIGLF